MNLPHLQNCIKKDPSAYQEEFQLQYRHYESVLQVLMFNPSYFDKEFESLVMFLAHTCPCYKKEMSSFPEQLVNLLKNYSTGLHRASRLACCKALMVLRSKSFVELKDLLPLFFELCRCQDKSLRSYINQNIISDIKSMNKKSRNEKVNRELQRFMFSKLSNDQQVVEAKMALDIMAELYKKNVWRNRDLVNQIAEACLSRCTKILVTALQFFLGTDDVDVDEDKSSDDEEEQRNALNDLKEKLKANKFNKNTRKRQKLLDRVKKTVKTVQNKEKKVEVFNFSALHLINDPQTLSEKLLSYLECTSEKYEVKLMMMNFISRLIGIHELQLLNFYPYITRYIQPHQTDVTKILQYAAQSSHKLVPPDELEPILKAITNNFVNEKNSTEAITVGLNSIRELCARNPLVMSEDLLQDLCQYQKYKNKNVSIAAKSLVHLFRIKNPDLLSRKDRGRPIAAYEQLRATQYGQVKPYVEQEDEEVDNDDDDAMSISDDDVMSISDDGYSDEDVSNPSAAESEESLDENLKKGFNPDDRVRLEDIERIYKKPKHNKESRLATVLDGRAGREKFGKKKAKMNERASTTNRDKKRNKAFGMIKHKLKRHTKKKTFQEKQLELKQKLLNKERAKR